MPQNFIESRRDHGFLLPPDVRDWLPGDHLAWFVIDAVAQLDLSAFYGAYRADGHGAAAYEPSLMVTLLLYAYSTGVRSSRGIERHCCQDVAYRVVTGNVVPDHATVARFVVRHERVLAELFGQVLELCDRAGLVKTGVVAVDGTRLAGNASKDANREFAKIAREIVGEAKATDEAEDAEHGQARGDELPEALRTVEGRRAFFAEARRRLEPGDGECELPAGDGEVNGADAGAGASGCRPDAGHEGRPQEVEDRERSGATAPEGEQPERSVELIALADGDSLPGSPEYVFDTKRIVARVQGREGWPREARRQLEEHRFKHSQPVPRSRGERLLVAAWRLEEDLEAERLANAAYEYYRAHGRASDGRRFGKPPKPYAPPEVPEGKVNVTDPDSHYMKTNGGYVQGYNAQAVVSEQQIVLAAEITTSTADWSQLDPMVNAAIRALEQAGIGDRPRVALADCQYWNEEHMDEVIANKHIQVLIPPESGARQEPRPGWTGGRYDFMRAALASEAGKQLYHKRPGMIEPLFAQTKHNRGITRFLRRGRSAVRTEWRLLMATHNLAKLHRHNLATARA